MKDLTPRKEDLNPIEIASRDEIAALQLERMKWSLAHAYENVPFYKASFDKAGGALVPSLPAATPTSTFAGSSPSSVLSAAIMISAAERL